MAGTLGDMKARIADEIVRPDLSSQIALAIDQAIATYQDERWHWSRRDDYEITASIGQSEYELDNRIAEVLAVKWTNGSTVNLLSLVTFDAYRWMTRETPSDGDPCEYTINGDYLRVYPPPVAAGTIQIDYWSNWPAPQDDGDEDNEWMIQGERLIRAAAKRIIYSDVDPDDNAMAKFAAIERQELGVLRRKSNRRLGVASMRVEPAVDYGWSCSRSRY